MRRLRAPRSDDGQSLIEFALLLPVLLLLVVGLIDAGGAFISYTALGNAVRESARVAAVHGAGSTAPWGPAANDANVTTEVRSHATGLVAQNVTVTSSWPAGNNGSGTEVVVSASYGYRPSASSLFLPDLTVPLSATTRTRIYR